MKTHPSIRIEILEARIAPAAITTLTWQGDLATTGWDDGTVNTNTNWLSNLGQQRIPVDGNILAFPAGAPNKTNVNDIAGLDLRSLSFTGVGYNISGQPITLSNGVTANLATAGTSLFHPAITLKADQTFSINGVAGASVQLDTIDLAGKTLTVDGTLPVSLGTTPGTEVTGPGTIIKNGTGILNFGQPNDFTGPLQVNAGLVFATFIDSLGAGGAGNGTAVAGGATLKLGSGVTGTLAEDLTLSGAGAVDQLGALALLNNDPLNLTGALRLGGDATIDVRANAIFTLAGPVGAADDALGVLTISSTGVFNLAFAGTATFTAEIAGITPGATGHDQLKVLGTVNLGGATLEVVPSFTPGVGAQFVIVDNDGTDAITGTFNGLAEGAAFTAGGVDFTISYKGVDGSTGNDAVLTVASLVETPLPVAVSGDGKTATFTDVDGDLVTVKTNRGPFLPTDFTAVLAGGLGGGQLQQINLTTHPDDFAGADLTLTAKPGPLGGNGFVNVGYVNATGIDLGAVKIAGDLGRILAGTAGGDAKVPGLKSLTVQSIGLLGNSTQAAGGGIGITVQGALPKLVVKDDLRAGINLFGATEGKLGVAQIGGSIVVGTTNFTISAQAGIGSLKVGGDIRSTTTGLINITSFSGALGTITVGGSIVGGDAAHPVSFSARGQLTAPTQGLDIALKSLAVKGSVEQANFFFGTGGLANADASVGSITVGGDWIANSLLVGAGPGADVVFGTADDTKVTVLFPAAPDNPALFSTIGSFTVKGQALGTATSTTDMFTVVAERIGKAKVGGRTFAFTNGATPEAFFAAPTLDGEGAENPVFDFTIREIGSTTPAVAFATDFDLGDGKTVTFTDVDGDLVTVKRSAGTFGPGDFTFAATTLSGGGQLTQLFLAPLGTAYDVTITAKPTANGGNGFVNIGFLAAFGAGALGKVSVAGDLGKFAISGGSLSAPAVKSFTAHSLGALGTSTGAGDNSFSFFGSVPKLAVAADVRGATIVAQASIGLPGLGQVTIGGSLLGGADTVKLLSSDKDIATLKIGGGIRSGTSLESGIIDAGQGFIGTLSVGGDIVGSAAVPVVVEAFGQTVAPAAGLDLAIKSFAVKGSVERLNILAGIGSGLTNADAAIGKIEIGRHWIASNALAGAAVGADTFFGTGDDTKVASLRDNARFSTIASIVIKGQALGSTAASDSFGIVAEQIGKAKIGAVAFKFDKGERDFLDAFAAAPTGPGGSGLPSDFFLHEIIV